MNKTLTAAALGAVVFAATASFAPAAVAARAQPAQLMVVQAVPGEALDVAIDGKTVEQGSKVGSVLGPFAVSAGRHEVTFTDGSGETVLATGVDLKAASWQDLVLHLPADVGGDPVANVYRTPRSPIGADKARVLIAHTATVAPADVRVDGTVVFRNIANGEYATADVPAGSHIAELLPTGLTRRPILGPLTVDLAPETATMVYAVGDPTSNSMRVIAHTLQLAADGAEAPKAIDTGSAGLAAGIKVTPFSGHTKAAATTSTEAAGRSLPLTGMGVGLGLLGLGLVLRGRRRPAVATRG